MTILKQNIILLILIIISQISFSQNKVNLELNLQDEDEYLITTKLLSTSEQEVYGEMQTVKKEIEDKYKLKILNTASDSSFYIKLTFTKFRNIFYINDEIIVIDSDSTETQNFSLQDSSFLNIEKGFNFEISKHGNILSIDSITFINSKRKNKAELKRIIANFFIPFPKGKLNLNDFWISNDTIKGNILNIYNKKYIFTKSTDSTFIIDNTAKLSSENNLYKTAADLFIFYYMEGNGNGEIILDKKTGMIIKKNIIQSSSGKSEVKYSKDSGIIFSSPLKIENIISIQTKKISNNEN